MIGMEHFLELWASHAVAVVLEHAGTLEVGESTSQNIGHSHGGFHKWNGWFKMDNRIKTDDWGVPPKLGNLHMDIHIYICIYIYVCIYIYYDQH